ncbi:MAG: major capsid protein [Microvirus sp.]|nr:MAG: major capsid protein [Microvirus sp.]
MSNRNIFNSIQLSRPKNNMFDLSHDVKLSLNMADLVPIMCTECVPGDKINIAVESLLRFSPLVSPVMHRMDVTFHYFFVPNRILWEGWEDFITNTKTAGSLPAFPTIQVNKTGSNYNSLLDYMGIPDPQQTPQFEHENVNAIPFAAYQKIYDEYYRDQNLIESVYQPLVNGDNSSNGDLYLLRTRCWEHDYFTSALPFAQKGDPVQLPVTIANSPIKYNLFGTGLSDPQISETVNWQGQPSGTSTTPSAPTGTQNPTDTGIEGGQFYADNSNAGSITTINDLRRAYALQKWLEKAARAGSRYFESILVNFGLKSPDSRLDRPEYITGSKSPVIISEVLNTTGDTGATDPLPQGNMSGHALSITNGNQGSYFCQEHGYVIGIMSVLPKTAYQQGIPRHFLKIQDPTQYFTPDFANIGEQEILNKEIMAFQDNGLATFGYTPRYAEYKYESNRVAGDFRGSLDFWHEGRIFDFGAPPSLNAAFVTADPSTRIFAVTDPTVQKLYAHVFNKVKMVRPMPKFGTPMI